MFDELSYTERSWGIDLISEINHFCRNRPGSPIWGAAGEEGLKGRPGETTLFPDVLIKSQNHQVIMGWELKFPDTPVDDEETIKNAIQKCERLSTNSFLIWNVNDAVLYQRIDDNWEITYSAHLPLKVKRSEVRSSRAQWSDLLRQILSAVSDLVSRRKIRAVEASLTVKKSVYREILQFGTQPQVQLLKKHAENDRFFWAHVNNWATEATQPESKGRNSKDHILTLLAQNQIVNWINKIVFSHHLKQISEDAFLVDELNAGSTVEDYLSTFEKISSGSDFKSIFTPILGQELVSQDLFSLLQQLQAWMKGVTAEAGGSFSFEESLASGLESLQGKSRGQFATPPLLARLLVGLTVRYPSKDAIDPCAGTGTIAKELFNLKLENGITAKDATNTTWASDKFSVPLGFAGISLANPSALGEVQQVFRADVADLMPSKSFKFIDPVSGHTVEKELPQFEAIVSNLPFVQFENISETQDQEKMASFSRLNQVSLPKADLYSYIVLGLKSLITENGRIGVITSNSWLGTGWGKKFRTYLLEEYDIKAILFSANGRWFKNASVVTTILILEKATGTGGNTIIGATDEPIDDWTTTRVDNIANHLLIAEDQDARSCEGITYSIVNKNWLTQMSDLGISWTSGIINPEIVPAIKKVTTPANEYFKFGRGNRSGWDKMFFIPKERLDSTGIEDDYLVPLLHAPRKALKDAPLSNLPTNIYLFNCHLSFDELEEKNHYGALDWIKKYQHATNNVGKPLPESLQAHKPYWYSPGKLPWGEFMMQLNVDATFGVYRPSEKAIPASQRFIVLTPTQDIDKELMHALLNSVITLLWQELTSTSRGEGALNRDMTTLSKTLRIPNPRLFTEKDKMNIIEKFAPLAKRPPLPIEQELKEKDRIDFDTEMLSALGIGRLQKDIYSLLPQLVRARKSSRSS